MASWVQCGIIGPSFNHLAMGSKIRKPHVFNEGILLRTQVCVAACQSDEPATLVRSFSYDRLLPCPPKQLPARIEHLFVEKSGNVVDIICQALSLPRRFVLDLIEFGAVYHALRCPEPPEYASPERLEVHKKIVLLNLPPIKGMTAQKSQRSLRVPSKHEKIKAGAYLRVHVHPRRFPRCYEVDWSSRIIADHESFVVLDKPAGVPVGASVDNRVESCAVFAARALGMPSPLMVTHNIDNCTEGSVVLAKDKEFVAKFNRLLMTRQVSKHYLVLAAAPVAVDTYTHYMQPGRYSPHIVSEEEHDNWHLCTLQVLECNEVPWPSAALEEEYAIRECGWKLRTRAYECKVRLITGRTHQVRAQFAALGAPIIGDTIYMPAAVSRSQCPECDPTSEREWSADREDEWINRHGSNAPELAIGLQACSISWSDDEGHSFQAGLPWWRC